MKAQRVLGYLVAAAVLAFCCAGCSAGSNTSGVEEHDAPELTAVTSYYGVTFDVDPSWPELEVLINSGQFSPSSANVITVTTFTEGEAESLQSVEDSGAGLLGYVSDYELDKEWEIDGGTSVKAYTNIMPAGYMYSAAIGNNAETGAGFLIFFNRGEESDPGELDDATYEAILESIEFDPSEAQPYVPIEELFPGDSADSDSSSADATDSAQDTPSTDGADVNGNSPTLSQLNALSSAQSYLSFTAFSHDGLIDQLEYEGYSTEDATWAADNCGADWNAQALSSARSYLDFTAFSYSGLIDQLEYEGFTTEQATYGTDNCGADWNEQAAKSAQSYLDFMSFSRDELIGQLQYEGFTYEQAVYGVTAVGL